MQSFNGLPNFSALAPQAGMAATNSSAQNQLMQMLGGGGGKGQKISNTLAALAPVAASFRHDDGRAQQMATERSQTQMATNAAMGQQKIGNFLGLLKATKGDPTADMQNFEYAVQNGYKGTFEDFMKIKPTAGVGMIPGMAEIMQLMLGKVKGQLTGDGSGGGGGGGQPKPAVKKPTDLGGGFTLNPY